MKVEFIEEKKFIIKIEKIISLNKDNPKFKDKILILEYLLHKMKLKVIVRDSVNIKTNSEIFNSYIDYPNYRLARFSMNIKKDIKKYSKFNDIELDNFEKIKKNRIYKELIYKKSILDNIMKKRKLKYNLPVK
jgi:hypothetical protein